MKTILLSLLLLLPYTVDASNKKFVGGYYKDLSGNKIEGYIYYKSGTFIKFKSDKGEKAIKLTPDFVKSFHIDNKDFVVIQNFKAKSWSGAVATHYDSAFAEVLLLGDINVYRFKIHVNNGNAYGFVECLIIEKGLDITQVKQGPVKFRKQIIPFISDNEKLAKLIETEKMGYQDLKRIITIYNSN